MYGKKGLNNQCSRNKKIAWDRIEQWLSRCTEEEDDLTKNVNTKTVHIVIFKIFLLNVSRCCASLKNVTSSSFICY